jgi:hypothetical protein
VRLGINISVSRQNGGFGPASLFSAGQIGGWYDPSDLNTLFQDSAGTTPVTAAGQPVGRILDKSGRGNHATQTTAGSRPIYGINPITGTRNLLTFTEQFDNAIWTKTACTVTSQGGGVWRVQASAASTWVLSQLLGLDGTASMAIDVKSNGAGADTFRIMVDGGVSSNFTATSDWQRFSFSRTHVTTGSNGIARSVANDAIDVLIRFPQLETGSTATAYQKVVTQYEVTEAGVASASYLLFDGVDDFLVTPTITPGTDKSQVFTGLRKLSDAATGIVVETSTNFNSFSGAVAIQAPNGALARYSFTSRGTAIATAATTNVYAAPITNVLTGIGDIAADTSIIRVNGVQAASVTTDQGTGNYLAYPMYIGRRAGTLLPFNGYLYGLVVRFGPNLDAGTISATETWMNSKTGAY